MEYILQCHPPLCLNDQPLYRISRRGYNIGAQAANVLAAANGNYRARR